MMKFLSFLLVIIIYTSCSLLEKKKPVNNIDDKNKMMAADRAFSKLSMQKGMKNAFMEYIDSNGVLLRPNQFPIVGADAIDFLSLQDDSTYNLQWEPKDGAIALSGELGYTYGVYALKPVVKDTTFYGTYVSIWKKQKDGTWKFVLDSGNEGIGTSDLLTEEPE